VVLTTTATREQATTLVRDLLAHATIACGTIVPGAVSIYRWQDAGVEESEVLVILKTTGARWAELRDRVRDAHPYEVPELLALPVAAGLEPYLHWLTEETGRAETTDGKNAAPSQETTPGA